MKKVMDKWLEGEILCFLRMGAFSKMVRKFAVN